MERYKSIVKSVVISGARHAFLLSDGTTWVSVFLRKEQKPEFQQAIRGVGQGQEYIFDCFRNERNFLNVIAIQHPTWPAPIPAKDVIAGAPAQVSGPPPMPGPVTAPPVPQPAATLQPINAPPPAAVAPPPLPPPQAAPESPAPVTLGPPPEALAGDQPPTELTEPSEISLKDRLIARQNATLPAANLLCTIIEKGTLPEDVESFITWVGVKFVQLQDIISSNTTRAVLEDDRIPF